GVLPIRRTKGLWAVLARPSVVLRSSFGQPSVGIGWWRASYLASAGPFGAWMGHIGLVGPIGFMGEEGRLGQPLGAVLTEGRKSVTAWPDFAVLRAVAIARLNSLTIDV